MSSCSVSGPLLYHLCFRNFNSTIPVGIIRVKSYVDSFLDPTCVPVWISINKPDLVPDRIVAVLIGVFRNGGGLGTGKYCIPVFYNPLCIGLAVFPM